VADQEVDSGLIDLRPRRSVRVKDAAQWLGILVMAGTLVYNYARAHTPPEDFSKLRESVLAVERKVDQVDRKVDVQRAETNGRLDVIQLRVDQISKSSRRRAREE
jgi:hypothetical protein